MCLKGSYSLLLCATAPISAFPCSTSKLSSALSTTFISPLLIVKSTYILGVLLLIYRLIKALHREYWPDFKDSRSAQGKLSSSHVEKAENHIWGRLTSGIRGFHLATFGPYTFFFLHPPTWQNLFFYLIVEYIPRLPLLLPSCPASLLSHPPSPPTISLSLSLSLSLPPLPSILHSLRQTIKQAFPWLTCISPLPPHHPKPQTEGELQPHIQCGAGRSWIPSQIWVPQGFGPPWLVWLALLSAGGGHTELTSRSHRGKFLPVREE